MKLSVKYLTGIGACKEAIEAFSKQEDTNADEIIETCIKQKKLDWANWLLARLLSRENKIRYSIFAAKQVLEIYEKKYPEDKRPRRAIEAAVRVLDNDTGENRNAAVNAAYAAADAADAAYAVADAAYAAADAAYAAAKAAVNAAYAVADAAVNAADAEMKIKILRHGMELFRKQEGK